MATVVRPEIHTLTLADGSTLIVKKRLNTGERREMIGLMRGPDGLLDGLISDRATVLSYLVDWTVVDQDSKPIPIKGQDGNRLPNDQLVATLDALDPEDYKEIEALINTYDLEITAKRKAEKKIQIANASRAKDLPSASDGQAPSVTPSSSS